MNVKPTSAALKIAQVSSKNDLLHVAELFKEYAKLLQDRSDCGFQEVLDEIPKLPADYVPPHGQLLLAKLEDDVAGCGAMHKLNGKFCEIKRVYVRPEFRGKGIGRALTLELIELARQTGYSHVRLSTTPVLKEAIALYESLGFTRIDPYCDDPYSCPIFMELRLK